MRVVRFAGDFFAVVVFFDAAARAVVVFLAVERAGDFFALVDLAAVERVDAFFAVDVLVDLRAVDVLAVDLAGVDLAALRPVDFLAAALVDLLADVLLAVDLAAVVLAGANRGSFFSPATTAFSSAPGRNFATAVFLARLRSPVRGLRTMRAGRLIFSKVPKPVMPTFSPAATCRVMVSSTDSSACAAALLLPSKRVESASIS